MGRDFTERRRSPRVATEGGTIAALHVSVPIRVLDLSSDGLLLASAAPLLVGSTIRVVAGLAGQRLDVELAVRHVSSGWDEAAGGFVAGGSFPSYDRRARQTVEALLGASGLGASQAPAPRADPDPWIPPVRGGVWRDRPVRRPERPRPAPPSWISPAP